MYSKELEEIIDAALSDGVLTDKNRALVHKRGLAEGVDLDELDLVLNGRLAKMKGTKPAYPISQPTSQKLGIVVKCPSCGAQVIGGTAICPECGYTFSNIAANSSIEKLQERLDNFNKRQEERSDNRSIASGLAHNIGKVYGMDNTIKNKMDIISTFPVPNTRADLLEFLTMLQYRSKATGPRTGLNTTGEEDLSYAYWLLYSNCINKAKLSFSKDKDFEPYFASFDEEIRKTKGIIGYLRTHPMIRVRIIILIFSFLFFGLLGLLL